MRAKQLWINFSFLSQLRLVWDRITASRLTITYFIFSVVHCLVQTGLQGRVLALNHEAATTFVNILEATGMRHVDTFPRTRQDLRLCTEVTSAADCFTVWDGTPQINFLLKGNANVTVPVAGTEVPSSGTTSSQGGTIAPSSTSSSSATSRPTTNSQSSGISSSIASISSTSTSLAAPSITTATSASSSTQVSPTAAPENNGADLDDLFEPESDDGESDDEGPSSDDEGGVESASSDDESPVSPTPPRAILATRADGYFNISLPDGQAMLTKVCVESLNYPTFALERTEREDAALIIFNVWVLGMSIVAILNESIPHLLASLLTHILSAGWSGFQIYHTAHFRIDFDYIISEGACAGAPSFLGSYWKIRFQHEIPSLVLNCIALIVSIALTFYLIKSFGWKTFKRIGASTTINRLYKLILSLSIAIQLSLFFITITVGIWVDQLLNGAAQFLADHITAYKAVGIITILLIGPWLWFGWTGSRRESRKGMLAFFGLSILYVTAWLLMLLSDTFRWQIEDWPFFRIMAIVGLVLTMMTLLLGLVVRLNFGKGMVDYLNNGSDLPEGHFIAVNLPNGQDIENGGLRRSFDSEEKVTFPDNRPSLVQNTWELPEPLYQPTAPTQETRKAEEAKPKRFPSALKGVARYQGLFKNTSTSSST